MWQVLNCTEVQIAGYKAALEAEFGEPVDTYYDVIKKSKATGPKLKKQVRKRKDETELEFAKRKCENMETMEDFGQRMAELYIKDTERYQFKQVSKTSEDLREWYDEFCADGVAIRMARVGKVFSKVPYSCGRGENTCPYLQVCGRNQDINSEDFVDKPSIHPELNDE